MRRLRYCLLLVFLAVAIIGQGQVIYVSPTGNDGHEGTAEKPLATLQASIRKAREWRRLADPRIANGIRIILADGAFRLTEPVVIRAEDAGSTLSPTTIEAAPGARPILSGGIPIKGWRRLSQQVKGLPKLAQANVFVAEVPEVNGQPLRFRQLWVNGNKAVRAKQTSGALMNRIINWNKKTQTCVIPAPSQNFSSVKGMEMFIHQWWAIAILRIKELERQGDSAILSFQQPESKVQSEHPWPAPWLSKETGNSAFFLTNAIEFLDEPGEWYLDESARKIYYWPKPQEDMSTAAVIAPFLENIINIAGTPERPVSGIHFKGISFQHTGWLRPSLAGHVPHQAGMYMTEAYSLKPQGTAARPALDNQAWVGRPAAAVLLNNASGISLDNCEFRHLASTAFDGHKGISRVKIKGNIFRDIGGTAILAGVFSDEAAEVHVPYTPADEREVCTGINITNNFVTDAANEDWSCVGIALGYTRESLVAHNEVENVSYSGISMGWGWTPAANPMRDNKIISNYIHHYGKHNYDCAGIYTLSAQPGSEINDNRIDSIFKAPYAHLPSHWFYLYADEGSSGIRFSDNWTPTEKFLQNNNGPGNAWTNNGPMVSAQVRDSAGLGAGYQHLAKERTAGKMNLPINEDHFEMIELVSAPGNELKPQQLKSFLLQQNLDTAGIYRWTNRYVMFLKVADAGVLQGRLKNKFPGAAVRVYHDLFYRFSRKNHCADTATAKEWQHVILTANLVADEKRQQQYLDYHAHQFQKWPGVSRGFCEAEFQQLLLFRNGRQLMLVISIPKNKSLDQLNPRTTANNPEMVRWNKLMAPYQEGIAGTEPGETWVFFEKIK